MKKVAMIAVGFVVGALTVLFGSKAFSEQMALPSLPQGLSASASATALAQVDVTAYQNMIIFFNKADGGVYAYSSSSGRVAYSWKVTELGGDLEKITKQGASGGSGLPTLYTVQ